MPIVIHVRSALAPICVAVVLLFAGSGPSLADEPTRSQLVIHSGSAAHVFSVELADSPESRATGLMFRKELAPDAGMLFLYPGKARVSMWMKNTFVSLDMLFLDRDGIILHIAERTVPQSTEVISSRFRVKAVLELLAGTVKRLGLKNGDRVEHSSLDAPD